MSNTGKISQVIGPVVDVTFDQGYCQELPYPDEKFDVVLSSMMLHHLPRSTRQQCAREIARVLKSGGRVLAVDFGRAKQRGLLAHFHRHGHVEVHDIANLFLDAGLTPVRSGAVGMNSLNFVLAEASCLDPMEDVRTA